MLCIALMSMPAMHEDVEKRAGEKKQKGKVGDCEGEVRAMLCPQEIPRDRREYDESNPSPRVEEAPLMAFMIVIHVLGLAYPMEKSLA